MKRQFLVLIMLIPIGLLSCEQDNKESSDFNKGTLKGFIGLYEGNCMPSPGVPPCQPSPISTTIAITRPSENYKVNLLLYSATTLDDGTFEISLPEGSYSLFIQDESEFICSEWNCPSECYCSFIQIRSDSTTTLNAYIDHASW